MRKPFSIFILSAIMFTACQSVTTPTLTPTVISSPSVATFLPPTQIPETTPTLESLNLLPLKGKIPPHPLELNESYDGVTFEPAGFIDVNDLVLAIAFSSARLVLAVAVEGRVSLWNVISGQKMLALDGEMVAIRALVYGKGGYAAATARV